jgi:N-carbamoylputrescine amidase
MRVTVCELPNEPGELESAWSELVDHVREQGSGFVLLPEMPFYRWLAHSRAVNPAEWQRAVQAHMDWIGRLEALAPAVVVSTRPVVRTGERQNQGYLWDAKNGLQDAHVKYYLPDDPGFWEATWYSRGPKEFSTVEAAGCKLGFLICTEIWFNQHARAYGKKGVHLIVCPRATPRSTADKWVAGGRTAAVVSGAYCLSSNLSGATSAGGDYAGVGWIIEPEGGQVLGLTSKESPYLTLDLDLSRAERAKNTYPRYVLD